MFIHNFLPPQSKEETLISPFFEYLKNDTFASTHCSDCDAFHWQPRLVCPTCLAFPLAWRALPHQGIVHSFSRSVAQPARAVAIIELSTLRLVSTIEGDVDRVKIGSAASLKIVHMDDGKVFFIFVV